MDRVIIDVREPYEYSAGHVEGAVNIPLATLPKSLDKLDKTAEIIVYCASGARSSVAEKLLNGSGYSNVINGINYQNTKNLTS